MHRRRDVPAATCWTCLTTCCWAGLTATCYAFSAPWCILHLVAYCYEHHLVLSRVFLPAPAAPSRPASPLAEQQLAELEDAASAAIATTASPDISSPVRGKAGTKPNRAAPTCSDDGQGLQDTAAASPPLPLPSCLPCSLLLLSLRPLAARSGGRTQSLRTTTPPGWRSTRLWRSLTGRAATTGSLTLPQFK
jgi:hypothetical protein